jgi:hypothetical protein
MIKAIGTVLTQHLFSKKLTVDVWNLPPFLMNEKK